ncbi:vacuolar protein-sorting-associated protein 36-like [Paramacrobiotus metropolitanus]|uniref:vacuolar protein-sorting-associated protein 36-like n=1 Tax=Paramacrobiotus metropolitanus TaxID=2943436 RepID=UPI00244646A3|nr:vacuolar protein-sorting-associated protein 36-like [Paramacrobiotus metropolitanus]
MNRFAWVDPQNANKLVNSSDVVAKQATVRLYDGEEKTPFDSGTLYLFNTQLIWIDDQDSTCIMSLHLSLIVLTEEHRTGSGRSPKVVLYLNAPFANVQPVQVSDVDFVKLSFRNGGMVEFSRRLSDQISRKRWDTVDSPAHTAVPRREIRTGIAGIERNIQAQQTSASMHISKAFEDLNSLMKMAKETVGLSKSIVAKVKNRQGEITDDETTQLKSYLLSLGVDDPVTRDVCGNDNVYHQKLAKEVSQLMTKPLEESGGLMTLTDVYCRVNRARGFELVSPEDLLRACRQMKNLGLPTELRVFDTGVIALELRTISEAVLVERTKEALNKAPMTAEMFAKALGVSVVLAKEMLFLTEKRGFACRDESMEGLRFYPNRFVEP